MKICLVSPFFEPWTIGGAEKYVNTLAHHFAKENQVVVITTGGPTRRKPQQVSNLKVIELKQSNICTLYEILKGNPSMNFVKRVSWNIIDSWNFSNYFQIRKILDKEKPDLVHSNGIKGISPSLFLAVTKNKIPHIHTLHDYELISKWVSLFRNGKIITKFNVLDHLYIRYMRKISSNISTVLAPSSFIMNYFTKMGFFKKSKKYVINNGIKDEVNKNPKEDNVKEFIFLGRMHKTKGPSIAVKAFKNLKDKNVRLHMVGDGHLFNTVKKMARDDRRIIIHGYLSNEKLDKLLDRCGYGIIPSIWYENFGYVISEFMINGLPVIGSRIGGIPETIQDGYNGYLFNPGDVQSLHSIMQNILDHPEILKKQSENAINSARNLSIEKQLTMIESVYKSTLSSYHD